MRKHTCYLDLRQRSLCVTIGQKNPFQKLVDNRKKKLLDSHEKKLLDKHRRSDWDTYSRHDSQNSLALLQLDR